MQLRKCSLFFSFYHFFECVTDMHSQSHKVRGMSLRKVPSLGSNLASVTDLKKNGNST